MNLKFKRIKKSFFQETWDFLGFPLRAFLLNEQLQKKMLMTTLKEERFSHVLQLLRGNVLDIACGENEIIERYRRRGGSGIGADIFCHDHVDVILKGNVLPFKSESFDTVTIIASLNHIPKTKRAELMNEIHRVLKPNGIFIATGIFKFLGKICHKLTYWDFDQKTRKVDFLREEDYALSAKYIINLAKSGGLSYIGKHHFLYGTNRIFIFKKER